MADMILVLSAPQEFTIGGSEHTQPLHSNVTIESDLDILSSLKRSFSIWMISARSDPRLADWTKTVAAYRANALAGPYGNWSYTAALTHFTSATHTVLTQNNYPDLHEIEYSIIPLMSHLVIPDYHTDTEGRTSPGQTSDLFFVVLAHDNTPRGLIDFTPITTALALHPDRSQAVEAKDLNLSLQLYHDLDSPYIKRDGQGLSVPPYQLEHRTYIYTNHVHDGVQLATFTAGFLLDNPDLAFRIQAILEKKALS
jgi:hypothetical protein